MKTYHIERTPRDFYTVVQRDAESGETRPVRTFFMQSCALMLAKDCNERELPESRVDRLCETYKPAPYAYLGGGRLRRWRHGAHWN